MGEKTNYDVFYSDELQKSKRRHFRQCKRHAKAFWPSYKHT